MDYPHTLKRNLKRVGWGLMAILWGTTILFDFIPFGAGLVGTGLILLGVNLIRSIYHLDIKNDNMILGILSLTWGGLEFARSLLRQLFPSADLDWAIFAILLIGWGLILLARTRLSWRKMQLGIFANAERSKDNVS